MDPAVAVVNALRGWRRGLRNGVGRWYVSREADDLAHQAVKYQQRGICANLVGDVREFRESHLVR